MVIPAVGYAANRIPGVPYDEKARTIANEDGRVVDPASRSVIRNEYVVGWARSGPQGLIGEHKRASAHVVEHLVADGAGLEARPLPPRQAVDALLRERGVQVVSFEAWKRLDDVEVARGSRRGAPRDKLVDVAAMLEVPARRAERGGEAGGNPLRSRRAPGRCTGYEDPMAIDTRALGELEVKDADGAAVRVASAWARNPALLIFLRHFG
jgi:hypothetical protein